MEAQRRAVSLPKLHARESVPHKPAVRFEATATQRHVRFSPAAQSVRLGTDWACWLCGKAVSLEASQTDEYGKSVHEECYVARLALEKASAQWVAQHTLQKRDGAGAGAGR
jgi:hypothetical protein